MSRTHITRRALLVSISLVVGAPLSGAARADDGNLQQRLAIEQQRDGFAAKLERLRAEARERDAEARDGAQRGARADRRVPTRSHQSMRLEPRPIPGRTSARELDAEPPAARGELPDLREQALRARQRHRAQVSDIAPSVEPGYEHDYRQRYELNRARTERKRSSFQRKLAR